MTSRTDASTATATPLAVFSAGVAAKAPRRSAILLGFATIYLLWGSTYLGIRVAVETMPPFLMPAARFLIAGLLLFGYLKSRGAGWPSALQWRANAIIGTFLLVGGNGLVVWAEQYIPSGVTALLVGIAPLFIVLTEWAWPGGARPKATTIGAMLIGFAGVAWLAAPWKTSAGGALNLRAVTAILAASIFWAIGSIYSRYTKHRAAAPMAAALQMLSGGAVLVIVALLHGDFVRFSVAAVPARSWIAFFYLIGAGSLIGFSTFVWLMKHTAPARVSTYAYVNPIVAVFLGWLLLKEPITSRTLVASAIIVAAVAIITMQKAQAQK